MLRSLGAGLMKNAKEPRRLIKEFLQYSMEDFVTDAVEALYALDIDVNHVAEGSISLKRFLNRYKQHLLETLSLNRSLTLNPKP